MEITKILSRDELSINHVNTQLVAPAQEIAKDNSSAKPNNRGAMRMMKQAACAQPNIQKVLCLPEVQNSELLHQAISENNIEAVRFLIGHGVNINALNANGNTPLITALEKNFTQIAEILINAKADLELRRKDSFSPLEIAISLDSPIATQLLNAGANPNSGRAGAPSPLTMALERKKIDLASLLIQKGAEINVGNSRASNPLYQAFLLNEPARSQMITQLLQKSADPNRKLENQMTVFCAIIEQAANQQNPSNATLIQQLCAKGADVHAKNASGQDALSIATAKNRNDIMAILNEYRKDVPFLNQQLNEAVRLKQREEVKKWLSKGANINNFDLSGQTNLYRIYMQGDTDFAQFLVDQGANIAQSKLPALAEIIEKQMFQGPTLLNVTEFCLRNGAVKPNDLDQYNRPLISIAVMMGNLDLVQLMIKYKASVEPAQKINGMSPLLLALKFNNEPITKLLIENGANVNAIHEEKGVMIHIMEKSMIALIPLLLGRGVQLNVGNTSANNPLAYAIHSRGDFNIMKQLIEKGADVNYKLQNGQTALFFAINAHKTNCVEYLLQNGSKHDIKDNQRHSPMWHAIQYGFQDIVTLLLKHGANHEDIG